MQKNSLLPRIEFQTMVFTTGAAVLILEIVATRLFSPYFGNTIFSISSILSVVLLALSLGYFFGGILADRCPAPKVFYLIIFFGGIASYAIYLLEIVLLPLIAKSTPISLGPLIASLSILFIPCLLMGLLCPFAIKLVTSRYPNIGVGRISGEIFFWSTTGSITGSLLTGFYLVPNFRIDYIIIAIGMCLTLIGIVGFVFQKQKSPFLLNLLLIIIFLLTHTSTQSILTKNLNSDSQLKIIHTSNGIYERIRIFDGIANGRPARFLEQDRTHSGAIYLDNLTSAYEYADYFEIFRLFHPNIGKALILGGGAYIIPQALLKYISTNGVIDIAEIEPELFGLSKKYFGVSEDPRLRNHIMDGRLFLKQSQGQYNLIFCDVYRSIKSMPSHFTTIEFFEEAKSKLAPNGLLITNIIGTLKKSKKSFTYSLFRTIEEVFPNTIFIALNNVQSEDFQNIMAISTGTTINLEELKEKQWEYIKEKNFEDKIVKLSNQHLEQYQILTDMFSPVDYLIAHNF